MYVDAITIAAVADEWNKLLKGARIDTIIQPTEYAIALQCYAPGSQGVTTQGVQSGQGEQGRQGGQNRWVYLSAHPQLARAHITAARPAKIASEPPAFVMLLRKHLEGARIEMITHPRWERVLEVIAGYRSGPDSDERIRFRLIIEIMGRMSNIILCSEDGLILGSLKRVGADVNRYRVIAAGVPYVPPPPQQRIFAGQSLPRLEPTTVTATQLAICAAGKGTENAEGAVGVGAAQPVGAKKRKQVPEQPRLWQLLTKHLSGMSPLLAREAVYRTTEDAEMLLENADDATWQELAWNVRELTSLYDTHKWSPQLVERVATERRDGGGMEKNVALTFGRAQATPVAFATYVLEQYAQVPGMQVQHSPSINVILDDYYARAEWQDAVESIRAPIRKVLQAQLERCKRKAELLQQELASTEEAARYRQQAELLFAHQHEVLRGQNSVELPDFFTDTENMPPVTIPLDPRFDAVGNANRLFNKYHKLRRALELIPGQIEQNVVELATIEQLLADLALAETPAEVALVKAEVQSAGYLRGKAAMPDKKAQKAALSYKKGKGGKAAKGKPVPPGGGVPMHLQSRDGFMLLIGKNSRQNEEITFHQATGNDIWLHARGVPGSHVIIKAAGRDIPHKTIEQAASLAAYYSQARGSTSVPVDYTLQRYVRHMKGGGPGMVIYDRERTIYAEPAHPVSDKA